VPAPVIVVHGGAGARGRAGRARDAEARDGLAAAVACATAVLDDGGDALDAAQAAVESLEDRPCFNAGIGSVLTSAGQAEMDAALMDGRGRAGAVAIVRTPRHPIALARAVLEHSAHVLLGGEGAEAFGAAHGVDAVPPGFHVTDRERARAVPPSPGTVGAVVLDARGGLAAATSTGGMRGQHPGRVGDSPLIGAGTYADERCAISASGHGEALIRAVAAHEVAALVQHARLGVAEAAERVVASIATDAALIAVGADGSVALPFNTKGFSRAWRRGDGPVRLAIE
jgi:beta-aspartyl-peptidase (threonine type)